LWSDPKVATFRRCLNCFNKAPQFIPYGNSETTLWESFTVWEQTIETFFTPEQFEFVYNLHGPTLEDFDCKIKDFNFKSLHYFFSTDYLERSSYILGYGEVQEFYVDPYQKGSKDFKNPHLSSLELDWEYSSETLQKPISRTRLLISSNDNGFHFFFRQD
jgi:hypothetical protein